MGKAVFVLLLFVVPGFCQTSMKESDTLQALLAEVHQLRQDIEAMTVASQRVQIAMYALQMQDAAVARATQRLDDAHNRCSGLEADRAHKAAEIQRLEGGVTAGTLGDIDAKAVQSALPQWKSEVEAKTAELQACQDVEGEASGQLRNDQAKLADLQDRIDRLDKTLEKLATAGK